MDVRKVLAMAALAGAALAIEAAVLHRFVAAPLDAALRAARPADGGAAKAAARRPELTEEIEIVALRRASEPRRPSEKPQVAGASRQ